MPTCCDVIEQLFSNAPTTSIPYGPAQQAKYGPKPQLEVWYSDGLGGFYLGAPSVKYDQVAGQIVIDHGGNATGIVRVN